MSIQAKATKQFRELMEKPGVIRTLGAHDTLTAVMIEQVGFESVFISGFGASASLYGLPDLNFVSLNEMVAATRRMAHRVSIPVLADADTGHGDLHNAMHCVAEFEGTGAAGIILEDQIFPKRCGHFGGKEVISSEEMVIKIKAAVRARNDPDFVIVARTDAREPNGLDDAIDRVNRYCDAGADIAFVEAPLSVEELEEICRRVEYPKLANMLVFGKTPILSAVELEDLGFKIIVASIDSGLIEAKIMRQMAEVFKRDGHTKAMRDMTVDLNEFKEMLGVDKFLSLRDDLE
ncbi:MAG: oxaloacetate decarboxylase [Proteobacteria bacterium]|nr:oxaloacetate decarboxylase [Pseudomonadota bacterium]MCH8975999.1 oxaloacetate decarboxylase [Pseudomonadota bacterium]